MAIAFLSTFIIVVSVCVHSTRSNSQNWKLFQSFVSKYNKHYKDDGEMLSRFDVFQRSLQRQARLNLLEKERGGTALYGVNKFSDLTEEEFERTRCGMSSRFTGYSGTKMIPNVNRLNSPDSFDWRSKGVVTPVKDQKQCGSCWAFSVVETVESRAAILNFSLSELSTQEVLSCDPNQSGCGGGVPQLAFHWLSNGSIPLTSESNYPFISSDGRNYGCKGIPSHGLVVKTYKDVSGDESIMLQALVGYSPLSVAVNANSWQDYIGGIVQHHCSNNSENHAVVLVGYDMTGQVPYWIVRNTWGADWGVNGYLYLKYGANMCGVNEMVVYPKDITAV